MNTTSKFFTYLFRKIMRINNLVLWGVTLNYNKVIFVCNYAANYAGNFLASLNSLAKQLKKKQKKVVFIFPLEAKNKNWEID